METEARTRGTIRSVDGSSVTPKLRGVDASMVEQGGERCLALRDPLGIATTPALIPLDLVPIVARFTGSHTFAEIQREIWRDEGIDVPIEVIRDAASALEDALFLEGPKAAAAIETARRAFRDGPLRKAAFAGAAYPGEAKKLDAYITKDCIGARFTSEEGLGSRGDVLRALVLPHIDPWRGARGYGACADTLAKALPKDARTFVLLGTSHAPMTSPFCVCPIGFDTPLGPLAPHDDAIARLVRAASFDPHVDLLNHAHEHSIELSAVFLKHVLDRKGLAEDARIVPILCGLGEAQSTGRDPASDGSVSAFVAELRRIVRDENAVILAGADLAHVGPKFGDPRPADPSARRALEDRDRESLDRARQGDALGFFQHVVADRDSRRVCGTGPVYTLLSALDGSAKGKLLYYDQNVDPTEGSIVSHAGMAFVEER